MTKFKLPDLRGLIPISTGQGPGLPNYTLGDSGGTEKVTLTEAHAYPPGHGQQGAGQ